MSSRKLNREERKIFRGIMVKLVKFVAGMSPEEISLVCRIVMSKLNKMDAITVDPEDDE